jgi:hypothetical protein
VNLCKVFLSFVYICIAFRNPIIKRRRVGIPLIDLTLPHVCTYTKSGFPTSYVVVYFYIQWLRWEVIARGIAVYHCLRFLYIITFNQEQQAMLWCLYISYLLIFFLIESMLAIIYLIFLPPRYNWNIVESGVKHHKPNNQNHFKGLIQFSITFYTLQIRKKSIAWSV